MALQPSPLDIALIPIQIKIKPRRAWGFKSLTIWCMCIFTNTHIYLYQLHKI